VKLNLILTNYTTELVQERIRPHPDVCKFVGITELASLAKEPDLLTMAEDMFSSTRAAFERPLTLASSKNAASKCIRAFEIMVIRMMLGKSATTTFIPGVSTGKMTEEKLLKVKDQWARWLQTTLHHMNVAEATGYVFIKIDDHGAVVDLEEDRTLHVHATSLIRAHYSSLTSVFMVERFYNTTFI
jgi:hypothetical protein